MYDEPPPERGMGGAGTVHHVAWSSTMEDHQAWHERVVAAGMHPSPIIDRFWFRSIYFREPSGVLFEIATLGPGFSLDEDTEHLGETLILPPAFEHLRDQVEPILTPLPDPRPWAKARCAASRERRSRRSFRGCAENPASGFRSGVRSVRVPVRSVDVRVALPA